jgi:hypothetical protein
VNEPWVITDEEPWIPVGTYHGPGRVMLVNPAGRGHLAFDNGVWYRVRQSGVQSISPAEAILLRPLDIDTILSLSQAWMINAPASERALKLSAGLQDGAKRVMVLFAEAAGAL